MFVDVLMLPFDGFWGMCGENSCNVFHAALHGTLGSYLYCDALHEGSAQGLMLWQAFVFLESVGFFLLPPFCLVVFTSFSCKQWFGYTLGLHTIIFLFM
jgi:hypothetical protein